MKLLAISAVLLVLHGCAAVDVVIRPSETLYVTVGEGFVAYLDVPKSFGQVGKCWFRYDNDARVALDLNSSKPIVTERGESVLPFAADVCGIRVNEVGIHSHGHWTLEAANLFEETGSGRISISLLEKQRSDYETHVVKDVGRGSIACSKHASQTKYCRISSEAEEQQHHGCDWSVAIKDNATFDCYMYNWGKMEPSHERIVVGLKNSTIYTNATVVERAGSSVLRCQFDGAESFCLAQMPDGRGELLIMEGLYNGRYSAYDTAKDLCAMEIPKPYQPQEEGVWRILNHDATTGCLFYVGSSSRQAIMDHALETVRAKVQVLQLYDTDTEISELSCEVPFVVDACYLSDPNGTVYFPDAYKFNRRRMFGQCLFERKPVVAGRWSCGALSHDYDREVIQYIEVIVKPKAGEVLVPEVRTRRGSAVEFMCLAPFAEPLSHCAFVSPEQRVHLVGTTNSLKTAGRMLYFGSGLQHGECGIKITGVRSQDFGQWRCQMVFASGLQVSKFTMTLTESGLAHATSIGLGVGLTVIVVLIMGVVIGSVFYRRRNAAAHQSFNLDQPLGLVESVESVPQEAASQTERSHM